MKADAAAGEPAKGAPAEIDVELKIPAQDPGIPIYARVGRQYLHDGKRVAIPFYRDPGCIAADFDLLKFFDFPGPKGPGAFRCPLTVQGSLVIQKDAPLGTFPKRVEFVAGSAGVPIWFVDFAALKQATQKGPLTMAALRALKPLIGIATTYKEHLQPREADHLVVIEASGTLENGRSFEVKIKHEGDAAVPSPALPNEHGRIESIAIKLD